MSYYRTCPHCGANLDPGETCDCILTQVCEEARTVFPERFAGQTDQQIAKEIAGVVQRAEKAALSIASTDGGAAEQNISPVSASYDTK